MKVKFLFLIPLTLIFVACENDTTKTIYEVDEIKTRSEKPLTELQEMALSSFGKIPKIANEGGYSSSRELIALGKKLYFETKLSKDNTISCNSCHNLENGTGVDNLPFSPGNDGSLGGRNSPTTLNAALHMAQFWDGREPDVEAQAGGPILNPVEMAMPSEQAVIDRLSSSDDIYPQLFGYAFPHEDNPLTYTNLQKAIGAFERTLITPSGIDAFIRGDENALSAKEKRGLDKFISIGCTTCHSGPAIGGTMFQKFGVYGDYWEYTKSKKIDEGKYEVTKNEADKYFFKVPSLRNIAKTAPYFHDGSVEKLEDAITIMAKTQLNKDLSEQEIDEINAFLKSLSGNISY